VGNFGRCRSCGKQIVWVRTSNGKNMPCDPEIHTYRIQTHGGKDKIVTPNGKVYSAEIVATGTPGADGFGYISHFATCPNANYHRKR